MYVCNITRTDDELDSDILVGKNSMDIKRKIIYYICDFVFINYNISVNEDVLDMYCNIDYFSLSSFLNDVYKIKSKKDLIIQSFPTDKDHCIFLKFFDERIDCFPSIYCFDKKDLNKAKITMSYLVNDELIYYFKNDLKKYDENKLDLKDNDIYSYSYKGIRANITSLYKNGKFLEELLDNYCSLSQLENGKYDFKI